LIHSLHFKKAKILAVRLTLRLQSFKGASSIGCCQPHLFHLLGRNINKILQSHVNRPVRDIKSLEMILSGLTHSVVFEYLQDSEELEPFFNAALYFFFHFALGKAEGSRFFGGLLSFFTHRNLFL
jgi:hypothetical protein